MRRAPPAARTSPETQPFNRYVPLSQPEQSSKTWRFVIIIPTRVGTGCRQIHPIPISVSSQINRRKPSELREFQLSLWDYAKLIGWFWIRSIIHDTKEFPPNQVMAQKKQIEQFDRKNNQTQVPGILGLKIGSLLLSILCDVPSMIDRMSTCSMVLRNLSQGALAICYSISLYCFAVLFVAFTFYFPKKICQADNWA